MMASMLQKITLVCCILAASLTSIAGTSIAQPRKLLLPFKPSPRETINYAQRQGIPVKIRAQRHLKVMTGESHQSEKNIVALYIGLPIVDSSQDNIIIENVQSKQAQAQNMALSSNGNTLWIEYIDVKPGFIDEITITFSVDIYQRRANFSNIKPYQKENPIYQLYNSSNPTDNRAQSENLNQSHKFLQQVNISPDMDPVTKARRIYDYLHQELAYGKPAAILSGKKPHCGNYATLFVSLCRAAGVPARRCAGFAFSTPSAHKSETNVSGHNWAEFYVEGIGWIPVDPTMGDKNDSRKYYYFGSLDNARLCVSKSGYHDKLPLFYKHSAEGELIFTNDASEFKSFKQPDTIQGVHRFQYRYDRPIQISVPNPYGPSLIVLSHQGQFIKPQAR